jgi:hypothetical protein
VLAPVLGRVQHRRRARRDGDDLSRSWVIRRGLGGSGAGRADEQRGS